MDYTPPGPSVHGIFQARILEQIAISFSRKSFQPKDPTCISCVSCIGRWILCHWTTWVIPFFFMAEYYSIINIYIYHICIYSSIDGYKLHNHILVITNNAVGNLRHMYLFRLLFSPFFFFFPKYIPRSVLKTFCLNLFSAYIQPWHISFSSQMMFIYLRRNISFLFLNYWSFVSSTLE